MGHVDIQGFAENKEAVWEYRGNNLGNFNHAGFDNGFQLAPLTSRPILSSAVRDGFMNIPVNV